MSKRIPTIMTARNLVHNHGYDLAKTAAEDQRIQVDSTSGLRIGDDPVMWDEDYGAAYWTEVLNHLYATGLRLGWMELDRRRTQL